jgi:hypothetical protein
VCILACLIITKWPIFYFQEIADLEAKMREIRGIEKTDSEVAEDLD